MQNFCTPCLFFRPPLPPREWSSGTYAHGEARHRGSGLWRACTPRSTHALSHAHLSSGCARIAAARYRAIRRRRWGTYTSRKTALCCRGHAAQRECIDSPEPRCRASTMDERPTHALPSHYRAPPRTRGGAQPHPAYSAIFKKGEALGYIGRAGGLHSVKRENISL